MTRTVEGKNKDRRSAGKLQLLKDVERDGLKWILKKQWGGIELDSFGSG
jgi:hypothetical protein